MYTLPSTFRKLKEWPGSLELACYGSCSFSKHISIWKMHNDSQLPTEKMKHFFYPIVHTYIRIGILLAIIVLNYFSLLWLSLAKFILLAGPAPKVGLEGGAWLGPKKFMFWYIIIKNAKYCTWRGLVRWSTASRYNQKDSMSEAHEIH